MVKMREGYEGGGRQEGENLVPKDAIVYMNTKAWGIYYSPSQNKLYFKTLSYHSGDLELSLDDIEGMFLFLLENRK